MSWDLIISEVKNLTNPPSDMEITVKQNYPKQIGNIRVSEDVYERLTDLSKENDVSLQAVIRAVLEEAVYSGLVVKK